MPFDPDWMVGEHQCYLETFLEPFLMGDALHEAFAPECRKRPWTARRNSSLMYVPTV